MANLIEIIIQAKDDASSVLKGISGTLNSVGDGAIQVGTSMTLLTAPIAGFLGTALKEASDQQAALSQLNAVIKSTGGVSGVTAQMADDLANSLAKVTRFSEDATLGAENLLLTFTNISSTIFPDVTKTALDMSQALGQDLKSSAIQLGKALQDPTTGLVALRRVGVQFTDSQKAQIEALQKSGDLMGAQKIILAELSREFGGSAVAAGNTFAGGLDILNHSVQALGEKIGYLLMPILQKVTGVMSDVITRVTDWTTKNPRLTQMIVMFAAALVAVGPILIGLGSILKIMGFALAALTSPITLVIGAIGLLAVAFITNFGGIRDTVMKAWQNIQPVFEKVATWFTKQLLPAVKGVIQDRVLPALRDFGDAVGRLWQTVEPIFIRVANWFTGQLLHAVSDTFYGYVLPAIQQFGKTLGDLWALVSPGLSQLANWFLNDALPSILNFISGTALPAFEKLIAAAQGIWSDVSPYLEKFAAWFTTDAVPAIIAFVNGFQTNIQLIPFYAQYYLGGLWTTLKPLLQPILDWFSGSGPNSFGGAISTAGALISTAFASIVGTVQGWGKQIGDAFSSKQIVQTLTDITTAIIALGAAFLIAKGVMLVAALPTTIGEMTTALGALLTIGLGPVGVALLLASGLVLAYKLNWLGFKDTIDGPVRTTLENLAGYLEKPNKLLVAAALSLAMITGGQNGLQAMAGALNTIGGGQSVPQQPAQPNPNDMLPMNPFPVQPPSNVIETVGGSGTPFVNSGTAYNGQSGNAISAHDFRGPYHANTPYIVNPKAAPEVFIPSSSGTAVPNADQLGGVRSIGDVTAIFPNVTDKTSAEQFRQWIEEYMQGLVQNG